MIVKLRNSKPLYYGSRVKNVERRKNPPATYFFSEIFASAWLVPADIRKGSGSSITVKTP
jgi:hypothetical protein